MSICIGTYEMRVCFAWSWPQWGRWYLDQLYAACNGRVSDECRAASMDFVHDDEFQEVRAA